ncbi:MAG: TolC family protein [Armatimonadota bacterium]
MRKTVAWMLVMSIGATPVLAAAKPKKQKAPATAEPAAPAFDPSVPLTLPDAIASALLVSPRLEAARAGTAGGKAQKRAARAEGMPQVGVGATGTAQGPAVTFPGGGSLTPGRTAQGTVDLSVPIYTGGRVKAGKKAASAAERAALAREDAEAQGLVLEVTQAYLAVMEAKDQTGFLAAQRELDRERLRIGRVRLEAGIAAPLEVSRAEADLAETVQQEIEAQAQLLQAGATLNTLMGRPAETPLALAAVPETGASSALAAQAEDDLTPAEAREQSKGRPDLRALREDVQNAEAGVDQARAARRPFVSLGGNLLRRLPETLMGGFAWSLATSLVQTLFDGGRSRAQVEAARAERDRRGGELKEAERRAEEQVEQTRVAVEAAEKRLSAEETRVTAAEEALYVAQRRVAAGVAPELEVTEAEAVLTRARTDRSRAHYTLARRRAELSFAVGRAYPQTVGTLTAQRD